MSTPPMVFDDELLPAEEATELPPGQAWPFEALKRFRQIFKAVHQHSQRVESQWGVSSAQLWAMWELSNAPGMRVTELAKAMSIHQSTASNLLDKLVKKGLVERLRDSQDQRAVSLHLSAPGLAILQQATAQAHPRGLLQQALFSLPDPVLAAMTQNLDVLISEMGIADEKAAMEPMRP
ncbi:MAG: MarR family winged helix-turn-helix transcriptional regulator [Candidatus Methylumidiphilus sp.]